MDETQQYTLWLRMKQYGVEKWRAFKSHPSVTDEEAAAEMHKCMDLIEAGQFEEIKE